MEVLLGHSRDLEGVVELRYPERYRPARFETGQVILDLRAVDPVGALIRAGVRRDLDLGAGNDRGDDVGDFSDL